MDLLVAITLAILTFTTGEFAYMIGTRYRDEHNKEKEKTCVFFWLVSVVLTLVWVFNIFIIQPWRVSMPETGGFIVYHKNYPPEMTEDEKLDAAIKEKDDHQRWMIAHDRIDTQNNTIDYLEERFKETKDTVTELREELKKARQEQYTTEWELRRHIDRHRNPIIREK